MSAHQIESEIIECVKNATPRRYSVWAIGITDDPERRKDELTSSGRNVELWKSWKADDQDIAREVKAFFLSRKMQGKQMQGKLGGNVNLTHVYIF